MQELDARAESILAALKADSRSGATQLALNTLSLIHISEPTRPY